MTGVRKVRDPGPCKYCSGTDWKLIYPATAVGHAGVDEFACTTTSVSVHDDIVQCISCGLRSSVPTLTHADIVDKYRLVIDNDYLTERSSREVMFGWLLDRLGDVDPGSRRLIEFGSNVGLFLYVAEQRGWEAMGIEPSAWAVETGRREFDVDLRQGTIEDSDASSGPVDVGVMLDVLEHVSNPRLALLRMSELIAPGGRLMLSTIDVNSIHSRVRRKSWPWYIRSHLHYFSKETLTAFLEDAGFRIELIQNVPRSFHASYILHKGGWATRWWGRLLTHALNIIDPKVPTGWLGDIKVVIATRVE